MEKPIILLTRRLPEAVQARAARDFIARINADDDVPNRADIARRADGAAAILCCSTDRLDRALIDALPASVRAIATFSAGTDHIDLAAAATRGIAVLNTPDVLSVATAETAFLLILMAARRAAEGERLMRSGQWRGWEPLQLIGTQVSGRRLGIFGMGRIGRELARMARGFGMDIHYHNRTRLDVAEEDGAIFHESDETFLPVCDVLSLNAPGGAGTRHWLNAERIARLPHGAVVVNAARGSLIDDTALIAALRSGHVAHAGLDVYDNEPNLHPDYLALDNVALLPHLGSATAQTRDAMGFLALDGIAAVLRGERPDNLVG